MSDASGMRESSDAPTSGGPTGGMPTSGGPTGAPVRVLVAEDQALLRASLAALLDAEDDLEIVGQAADGARAVALAAGLRPDASSWTFGCRG